jgi:hypothetical protein
MPIYVFQCPNCEIVEDVVLPITRRDTIRFHLCGCEMQRLIGLPQPPIMKQTATDMALGSLNNGGLSPHEKGIGLERAVMQGLERNRPNIYKGV